MSAVNSVLIPVNYNVDNISDIFKAIHQCIVHSTIRHMLSVPKEVIIEYLVTQPYFRGADTLYYFLLRRDGTDVYYDSKGRHLISIQPELSGVYILAEQDMDAPINKGVRGNTIYSILMKIIGRMSICERYQLRHSIITGEASLPTAVKIPSIALNIPQYQKAYQQAGMDPGVLNLLINYDCWEGVQILNYSILSQMLDRMAFVSAAAPELWKYFHRKYYTAQLQSLQIHKILPQMVSRHLVALNTLLPDLIKLPPGLDTLGIRLWYTEPASRAYLLGCDISQGIPSNEIISEKLQTLQRLGIERYIEDVTGIYFDENNKLTGKIGEYFFPQIEGKKLINNRTSLNTYVSSHFVSDLVPIVFEDLVEIVLVYDFVAAIMSESIVTTELIIDVIESGAVGTLKSKITEKAAIDIQTRIMVSTEATRGISPRSRLVEIMSNDIVNY